MLINGWSEAYWGDWPSLCDIGGPCGYGTHKSTSSCGSGSSYGVAFCQQDQEVRLSTSVWDNNMYHGEVVYSFFGTKSGTCQSTQTFSSFWHTWSVTSINSIGVGPWAFSVGWISQGYSWPAGGQPGYIATVCGRH